MALRMIVGTMGSGKSYYGAELIHQYLSEGAVAHTNIDLVDEAIDSLGFTDRTVRLGDDPSEWIPKIRAGREGQENLVVIDEGMLLFDSHDWQATKKKHKSLLEFLVWSRKLGLDVFLIGQAQKGMDVAFTRMSLETISCVAVKTVPVIGPLLVTTRGDFLRVWKYPTGQRTGQKRWVRFDPKVGSIYRTESTHGKFEDIPREVGRAPKNEAGERRKLWAWVWAFVIGLAIASYVIKSAWFKLFSEASTPEVTTSVPSPPARVVDPPPPPSPPSPPPSSDSPPRFKVWGVADFGRLQFWESATGILIKVGAVYDDAIVEAVQMSGAIFKVRLDDERIIAFRPSTRQDAPKPSTTPQPWKPSFSASIWPPSGLLTAQP